MNITTAEQFTGGGDLHVLVLHDGSENDILGIWGPYPSKAHAETALNELQHWPLDGFWQTVRLKHFPAPATTTTTGPHTVTWDNDGDVYTGIQVGDRNAQSNTFWRRPDNDG